MREVWCKATVRAAVERWHRERLAPENAHRDIAQLAVECAWFTFGERAEAIQTQVELYAQRFAEVAVERFRDECFRVLAAAPPPVEREH